MCLVGVEMVEVGVLGVPLVEVHQVGVHQVGVGVVRLVEEAYHPTKNNPLKCLYCLLPWETSSCY